MGCGSRKCAPRLGACEHPVKELMTIESGGRHVVRKDRGIRWENWSKKCAHVGCRTSSLKAIFNGRGIELDREWYCSADCLESALTQSFTNLTNSSRPVESKRPARFPLGLMLFSQGSMNEEQFKLALENHRVSGERIGDVALQLGFVNEEQVAEALAAQWGYPVFSMRNAPLELPLIVPVRLMELHQMLPVQFIEDSGKLHIGFATRIEHSVLQGVEKIMGCVAAPCFVTISEFRVRMQHFPWRSGTGEFVFDYLSSPSEMAEAVKDHLVRTGATGLRFARCREYLWVRLSGLPQSIDLLFRLEPAPAQ